MITIEKKKLEYGSCNFCSRGVLRKDGIGLKYPYKIIYELRGNQLLVTICSECLKIIKAYKEGV